MPVKELQLETGGAADLLIQETGDSNDTILLEDSTSPTTQTIGASSYVTAKAVRVTMLGQAGKGNATSKGKEDRGILLSRLGAVRDIGLGSKVGIRVACGTETGRSRSLGSTLSASKSSGTAKACGEATGRKASTSIVAVTSKIRGWSGSYTRGIIVSGLPATARSRSIGSTVPVKVVTYAAKMNARMSGSCVKAMVYGKMASMYGRSRMKGDAIIAAAKNASCLTTSRIASVPASKFSTVLSGVNRSLLSARTMARVSSVVSTRTWALQFASKVTIVAGTMKSHAESRMMAVSRMIVCARSVARGMALAKESSCVIVGASSKIRGSMRGSSTSRVVIAKTSATIDRGMTKAFPMSTMATRVCGISESIVCGKSAAKWSTSVKGRSNSMMAATGSKMLAAIAKTRSTTFGQELSAAKISGSGKMASRFSASISRAAIEGKNANGRSLGRMSAGIRTLMTAFASCSGRTVLAGRAGARASAAAKSRALAGFSALCAKRITLSFAEYSRAGWFADIGKPVPEVYVYLFGKIDASKEVDGLLSAVSNATMVLGPSPGVIGCLATPAETEGYLSWLAIVGDLADGIEVKGLTDPDQDVEALRFEQTQVTEIRSGSSGSSSICGASIEMILI